MKAELMLMDSDMEILSLSKKDLVRTGEMLVNNFDASSKDPLQMLAFVSKMKLMLDTIEKGLVDKSINDLNQYQGKKEAFGIDFQISEVGVKYDYSENQKWVELNNEIKELEEKKKEMEKFIKALGPYSFKEVNDETGEITEWHPASKSSTSTIKKTIK